jgi:uncharacterized DUF497 family protein
MNRFDPAKDAINQEKHGLPLRFGDRIFEDVEHLIIPSTGDRRRRTVQGSRRGGWKTLHRRLCVAGRPAALHVSEKE